MTTLQPLLFEDTILDVMLRGDILTHTITFLIPLMFVLGASCVPGRMLKTLLGVLGSILLIQHAFSGAAGVLLNAPTLRSLETRMDESGVCLQSTDYTCGPAAMVTLLRRLGIPAEEGKLSLASTCTTKSGTSESDLARAVHYLHGIPVSVTYSRDPVVLQSPHGTLAMVKLDGWINHWVAILGVSEENIVTYGDPLVGIRSANLDDFLKKWRYITLRLHPDQPHPSNPSPAE